MDALLRFLTQYEVLFYILLGVIILLIFVIVFILLFFWWKSRNNDADEVTLKKKRQNRNVEHDPLNDWTIKLKLYKPAILIPSFM